jgi:hypothetical protein
MPIPMGIGIDMRVLRPINIVWQDDRDRAGMSMDGIQNSEFRIQKTEDRRQKTDCGWCRRFDRLVYAL